MEEIISLNDNKHISLTLASIIVNYKSEERTIKYIKEELQSKCNLSQVIIIVNNSATEESTKKLCNNLNAYRVNNITCNIPFSTIYVIHNINNAGFARGNNLGVDFVSGHFHVKYILFSNNDIRFINPNVIELLIDKLKSQPDVGVIGPKVIGLDGNCQSPNEYVPFWTEMVGQYWERFIPFYHIKHFNQNNAAEGYYYRIMGSFFIVKYKDFVKCGKFDSNTFLYGEEAILSERMNTIGKRNYYLPTVAVLHEHGCTTTKHLNQVKGNFLMFDSLSYYYHSYKGIRKISILLAKLSMWIYSYLQYFSRLFK